MNFIIQQSRDRLKLMSLLIHTYIFSFEQREIVKHERQLKLNTS